MCYYDEKKGADMGEWLLFFYLLNALIGAFAWICYLEKGQTYTLNSCIVCVLPLCIMTVLFLGFYEVGLLVRPYLLLFFFISARISLFLLLVGWAKETMQR